MWGITQRAACCEQEGEDNGDCVGGGHVVGCFSSFVTWLGLTRILNPIPYNIMANKKPGSAY